MGGHAERQAEVGLHPADPDPGPGRVRQNRPTACGSSEAPPPSSSGRQPPRPRRRSPGAGDPGARRRRPSRCTAGRRVDISRATGADEGEVQASLDGRVTAALLQQRGTVPLHLAGGRARRPRGRLRRATGRREVQPRVRAGRPRTRLLTDDLAALRWDANGRPMLRPGPARMRIWGSSARALGWSTDDASRVVAGADKYAYPLARTVRPCAAPARHGPRPRRALR